MLCPVCPNVELKMSERKGVEIDYCPKCRGVWLDRGELDKIVDLSAPERDERQERSERPERNDRSDRSESRPERSDDDKRDPRRRKSLLGDLFDF